MRRTGTVQEALSGPELEAFRAQRALVEAYVAGQTVEEALARLEGAMADVLRQNLGLEAEEIRLIEPGPRGAPSW